MTDGLAATADRWRQAFRSHVLGDGEDRIDILTPQRGGFVRFRRVVKRPYRSILVVLLHHGAVVYLAVSISALIVITALQIHSPRLFEILLEEMLRPGASPLAVFMSRQEELTQAAESLPALVAVCVTMVVGAAAIVWMMRSWAAYGDAFDTGPLRALIAALAGLASILLFVSLVRWVIT